MEWVDIEGVRLETAHIPGPEDRAPLLFLHEGLGSVAMWQSRGHHWPEELCAATGRAGWMYSRRGYGWSDPIPDVRGPSRWQGKWRVGRHPPDYMHIEAWRVLPRVMERLNIRNPVLIGHSDGASIALLYASRHRTSACVAIAPHVFVEDLSLRSIASARDLFLAPPRPPDSGSSKGLRERLIRFHADVDNAFWQWNDVWLSDAFRTFDIRSECGDIKAPLLAIQGRDDAYGTLRQIHEIAAAAPQAQTVELLDCGHSPHRDQPAALTNAIVRFLLLAP